jgi:hypothetical protein
MFDFLVKALKKNIYCISIGAFVEKLISIINGKIKFYKLWKNS